MELGRGGVVAVVAALGLASVGLEWGLVLLLGVVSVVGGLLGQLAWRGWRRSRELEEEFRSMSPKAPVGLFQLLKRSPPPKAASNGIIVQSPPIQAVIQEIIDLVIRDFVSPWYGILTIDESFKSSLKDSSCHIASVLSNNLSSVSWESLLTSELVDDFASHIRLYRKARERLGRDGAPASASDGRLESLFFDLELEMEKNYCRDLVSTEPKYENAYLHDLADALMFLVAGASDFRCRPLRFLLREVLVRRVLLPLVEQLSDPDFINYFIVWLLNEVEVPPEDFLWILEGSGDEGELGAVAEALDDHIGALRARDTGGSDDASIKSQLGSLNFVAKTIHTRLKRIHGGGSQPDSPTPDARPDLHITLPFILNNNISVSYFIDFLATVNGQTLIDLYLAIEGFKVSVEHQLSSLRLRRLTTGQGLDADVGETIREAARSLFDQYLAPKAPSPVRMDATVVRNLEARIRSEAPSESWFDEVQERLFTLLNSDVRFYPAFRQNPLFFRMLADLALINRDGERVAELGLSDCHEALDGLSAFVSGDWDPAAVATDEPPMEALITTLGIGREGNTAFALYQINVTRPGPDGASWNVQRRYSDFHTLNVLIEAKFPNLASLGFPGKKTFNNLNHEFLERRKKALNGYLRALLLPEVLRQNPGLDAIVTDFLCHKEYNPAKGGISRKVESLVRPLRSGAGKLGQAVTSVPDTVLEGVARMGDGLGKVTKSVLGVGARDDEDDDEDDEGRVGANLGPDSIPLRIILLLTDEIFGLRHRNQWFRRRLVAFLRQLLNATLGHSINRKIVEFVNWLTSEEQVVEYLKTLKATIWPKGQLFEPAPPRPQHIQVRSRMAAKAAMFSALPDELRLFIGSETSRSGTELVFEALQSPPLNRRLVYVFLERVLTSLFPDNPVPGLLAQLHSKSPRCRASPTKTG